MYSCLLERSVGTSEAVNEMSEQESECVGDKERVTQGGVTN